MSPTSGQMLSWTARLKGGPEHNYHVSVVVGLDVYSFRGFCMKRVRGQNQVHIFNTVSLRWKQLVTAATGKHPLAVPSIEEGYTAELIGHVVYVWGGCSYEWSYNYTLYAFNVDKHLWSKPKVSGAFPYMMTNHSACVLGKAMYVYGGDDSTNTICMLDTTTMVWSSINATGTPPPASSLQSSSVIGTKVFVFGGLGDLRDAYGNIGVFDTECNCWLETPTTEILPEGRCRHSAFTYSGGLYIFGGSNWNDTLSFNDLWRFNPEAFSWREVKPKGKGPRRPPQNSCVCCCVVGDRVILFDKYDLYVLDFRPSLKTLCKLSVIRRGLEHSGLPHNIRWEMAPMTKVTKKNGKPTDGGKTGKVGNRK